MISGNMVGSYSQIGKTFILQDENGNEITGIVTENVQVFDATPADVKIGKTFASSDGILEGTDTKTYRVRFSSRLILPGEDFSIPLSQYNLYNYTKFQAAIAKFNTSVSDSVEVNRICINDNVYVVSSTNVLSQVTKNTNTESVDLNIVNDTDETYIIYYNMYKEE